MNELNKPTRLLNNLRPSKKIKPMLKVPNITEGMRAEAKLTPNTLKDETTIQ